MKKVLVTGASGFIGRHVVEKLAASGEYEVVAVTSGRRKVPFLRGRIEEADLLDAHSRENLLRRTKPDILMHYAWSLPNRNFHDADANIEWLEASLSLLRLFREQRGQYFCFAGSSSEYGEGVKGNSEDGGPVRYSLYGKAKLAFEDTAGLFCKKNGMKFLSCRYFSVYGPWDIRRDAALPTAIQTLMHGEEFLCKSPNNLWDFVFIDDVATATCKLIGQDEQGVFNVATGQPVRMHRVFTTLADILGRRDLLTFAENPETISLTADISKLRKAIGSVRVTALEDGLSATVQWWKKYLRMTKECNA